MTLSHNRWYIIYFILKIDKLSWRVDYAEDLKKRYVLSLDLNVDVDVGECSEWGSVFQNLVHVRRRPCFAKMMREEVDYRV